MNDEKKPAVIERPLDGLVMLLCDRQKCPRNKKVPWDNTMPEGTATIVTQCPWHAGDTTVEDYYDALGRWWGPDGWKERHNAALTGAPESPDAEEGNLMSVVAVISPPFAA